MTERLADGWTTTAEPVPLHDATLGLTAQQIPLLETLTRRLITGKPMRWATLTTLARRGLDRVDVERAVFALHHAGWLEIQHRRDPRGDLKPRQVRLKDSAIDEATRYLGQLPPSERARIITTLGAALDARRAAGQPLIPERVLVQQLFGQTKRVRIREHRAELEARLGCPLETLVRFHVDLVLTAGPAHYTFRGTPVHLAGSHPWAAITQPVAAELTDLQLDGTDRVICIENQTPFESLIEQGWARDAVLVFTAGYLGTVQRLWLTQLVHAGVRHIQHWGDLDPWGLDIYRDLRAHVHAVDPTVQVQPWRMDPAPLSRPDAQKLTPADWVALHRYLKRPDAPLRATAEAMRRLGRKIEQEALLGVLT
jgi:hypothetical protein